MGIRKASMLLPLFLGMFVLADVVEAQNRRVVIQPSQRSYDVTIVSEFGIPVRVGIFGFSKKATFRLDFDGGRTGPDVYEQELIAGDRVVIVWDARGNRLLVADLTVDGSGTLVLAPMYGSAAAGAARAGAAPNTKRARTKAEAARDAKTDLPKLKIKPKRNN